MPFLVYRQDTHGSRFLIAKGLDHAEAATRIDALCAGPEHHQDYFIAEYSSETLSDVMRSLRLVD